MSFDSYANLLAEFKDWIDRTDRDAKFPSFLRLIEFDVSRTLKLRAQQKTQTGTLTAGSTQLLTPGGILFPRSLKFTGDGGRPIIIDSVAYQKGQELGFADSGQATPLSATVHGVTDAGGGVYQTQIKVWPPPTGDAAYELTYEDAVAPLGDGTGGTSTVTYLLKVHGDVYHHGALMHCARYDEDWENAAEWERLYEASKLQAKRIEWLAKLQLGRFRMTPQNETP